MQVQELNSRQLILFKPLKPNCFLFWFIFICTSFLPVLAIIILGGGSRLTCERTVANQGNCELVKSPFWIQVKQKFPLSDLREAKIEKSKEADRETGEYYYYVVLLIKDSTVPFTFTSRGGEDAKADIKPIVEEINQYIVKPEIVRLNIEQPEWIIILVGSIPFFAFNILFIALDIYEGGSNCILNRDRNSFTLTRKKWWRCIDVVEYPLSQIAAVEVDTSNNGGMGESYRVGFKLKSGEIIPLTQGYYSYNYSQTVSVIRQFLNLS